MCLRRRHAPQVFGVSWTIGLEEVLLCNRMNCRHKTVHRYLLLVLIVLDSRRCCCLLSDNGFGKSEAAVRGLVGCYGMCDSEDLLMGNDPPTTLRVGVLLQIAINQFTSENYNVHE